MDDFKFLKFLDRFKNAFEKIGVDYAIMRKILQVKFTMDGRRSNTALRMSSKKKNAEEEGNNFKKSLWIYCLLGLFMIVFVVMGKNYIFQMSILFGILMFMIMTTFISDFSSVLLDIRDKNILSTKPVNSITISMAKIIHISVYMFTITMCLTAPALIASFIKQGFLFFIVFLAEIILIDLFVMILTALIYMLILKSFGGEKLKDIINYVQIILTIVLTVGYQLIGRLFNLTDLNVKFTAKWWQYIIAPIWFGAPFEIIFNNDYNRYFVIFSILAVVVPIISIIIYIKMIPAFERNLQKLNDNSEKVKKKNHGLYDFISKIICPNKKERVFFKFASDMMTNEREFKLKVYPTLGMAIIFPFIFLFNAVHNGDFKGIASGSAYLNIYFCALLLPTVIMMLKYSGKYEGSWIYRVMPVKETAPIFKGTLKAAVVRLIMPIYIVESIIFILIFGLRIIPDLVLVFLNMIFYMMLSFIFQKKCLPFSQKFGVTEQGQGLIMIPLMALLGILVLIHFLASRIGFGVYIYMIVILIIDLILWNTSFKLSWDDVI